MSDKHTWLKFQNYQCKINTHHQKLKSQSHKVVNVESTHMTTSSKSQMSSMLDKHMVQIWNKMNNTHMNVWLNNTYGSF